MWIYFSKILNLNFSSCRYVCYKLKKYNTLNYEHLKNKVFMSVLGHNIAFFNLFLQLQTVWSRESWSWWKSPRSVKNTIEFLRSVNYSHDLWFWETKWHNQMQMWCCNDGWPRKSAIYSRIAWDYKTKSNYLPNFLRKAKRQNSLMW